MSVINLVSIVDDDESVRESLPDLLKEIGFASQTFSSAEEFLAKDGISGSNCLILDVAMPGMCGPELQEELNRRKIKDPHYLHHRRSRRSITVATCRARRSRMFDQAIS